MKEEKIVNLLKIVATNNAPADRISFTQEL